MRALGLPNTKHFHEITRIEDALARKYLSEKRQGYPHLLTTTSSCRETETGGP